jgi:Tol biopolymer transport system component/DNA-binding winged helix-turn-helix (wHTH) protein
VATRVSTNQTWRFDVYEVDTRRVELRRDGSPVKLREQSFLILVYLLEHAGEIVTREELQRVLWPSDTYVAFDHSLNMAVMKLRDALGDSYDTPLYIETIPKRGYRFIAPLSQAEEMRNELERSSPSMNGCNVEEQTAPAATANPAPFRRFGRIWAFASLIILVAIGWVLLVRTHRVLAPSHDAIQAFSNFRIVPITTAAGRAVSPSISPDGREVAFLWNGPDRKRYNLYVQTVGSETPLRLTDNRSGVITSPAFSPDGEEIAFTRCAVKNEGIYVMPARGGTERKLATSCGVLESGHFSWLANGKEMVIIEGCSADGPPGLVLLSIETGQKRCLVKGNEEANGFYDIYELSISPDNTKIAFTASIGVSCFSEIYTVPISGGKPSQLTSGGGCLEQLMWTPDSQSIVFFSLRTMLPTLSRVSVNGGPIQRESFYPEIGSFSRDGRFFVYSEQTKAVGPEIWRADLATAGGLVQNNRALISTQYPENDAQPSPDGSRIAWSSSRTGFDEIWISNAAGENPLQLTHLNRFSRFPRWSPDGKWIAFLTFSPASTETYAINSEGRNLHLIAGGPYGHGYGDPSWSKDGKFIYFYSSRTGSFQIWKRSLESGIDLQLTKHGGFDPFESYDGQTIYFYRFDSAGIWSLPVSGGTESLVVADKPQGIYARAWAVAKSGLYLLNSEAESGPSIEYYDFATRHTSQVLTLAGDPVGDFRPILGTTEDGRTLYYAQQDRQSVIKMMEISR